MHRRSLIAGLVALAVSRARDGAAAMTDRRLVLSSFAADGEPSVPGLRWRGFSDRVMGGVSDVEFRRATVAGRECVRLTGHVTRDRGGGFVQMALDLGSGRGSFDGSAYAGIELLVHGNDEDYNVHVRTGDCGWYDESYRATFHAPPQWERIRLPWSAFVPNGLTVPLDASRLQRIGLLGWMREFEADLALAEIALYA